VLHLNSLLSPTMPPSFIRISTFRHSPLASRLLGNACLGGLSPLQLAPRDKTLRRSARAQVQSRQDDPATTANATHKRTSFVAKNAFRDKSPATKLSDRSLALTPRSASPMTPTRSFVGSRRKWSRRALMSPKMQFRDKTSATKLPPRPPLLHSEIRNPKSPPPLTPSLPW
jgi:hypothetical protein